MLTFGFIFAGLSSAVAQDALGDWKLWNDFKNDGSKGSAWDGNKLSNNQFSVTNMGLTAKFDHSIMVELSLPTQEPEKRTWILNFGQDTTGAQHWLYNPRNAVPNHGKIQFGAWNGAQVKNALDITGTKINLITTYNAATGKYILYQNGVKHGETTTTIDITSSVLHVGQKRLSESEFAGSIFRVRFWDSVLSEDDVATLAFNSDRALGDWKQSKDFVNDGIGGAALNGEKLGDSQFQVADLGLTSKFPHTFMVELELPEEDPERREWILNFGQRGNRAQHLLLWPASIQFGEWGRAGGQVSGALPETGRRMFIQTTYDSETSKYTVYVDGELHGETTANIDISQSTLLVGKKALGNEFDFSGRIRRVLFWPGVVSTARLNHLATPSCLRGSRD